MDLFVWTDYDSSVQHCKVIGLHYAYLVNEIGNVQPLVDRLYDADVDVLTDREKNDIESEPTSTRQLEKLLSVLSRKSPEQFQLFLNALSETGFNYVKDYVIDHKQRTNHSVGPSMYNSLRYSGEPSE